MIINTTPGNRNNRITIVPGNTRDNIRFFSGELINIEYDYTYLNRVGASGFPLYFLGDYPLTTVSPDPLINGAIVSDEFENLAPTEFTPELAEGKYTFKIMVVDSGGAIKRLDYKELLYGFDQLQYLNLSYSASSQTYNIDKLNFDGGDINDPLLSPLVIPPYGWDNTSKLIKPITRISAGAFKNSQNLTRLVLGENIQSIGENAFSFAPNFINIRIEKQSGLVLLEGTSVFDKNVNGRRIEVPLALLDEYKTNSRWSEYAEDIFGY